MIEGSDQNGFDIDLDFWWSCGDTCRFCSFESRDGSSHSHTGLWFHNFLLILFEIFISIATLQPFGAVSGFPELCLLFILEHFLDALLDESALINIIHYCNK